VVNTLTYYYINIELIILHVNTLLQLNNRGGSEKFKKDNSF